jgi:SAM-dependent methyltransferase
MATPHIERAAGRRIFGRDAGGYEAGRLDYPAELYAAISARCGGLSGARIFEIGPGTGQATRALLAHGANVTAVEPDSSFAAFLASSDSHGSDRLSIRNDTFEAVALSPGTFDLGAAATSFGWLETESALRKVRDLLRPGGWWAMWWNVFQDQRGDPIFDECAAGLPRPRAFTGGRHYSLDAELRLRELAAAGLIDAEYMPIGREVALTPRALRNLYATMSPILALPAEERFRRLDAAEARAQAEAAGGLVQRHFVTPLYLARRPGP